MLSLQLTVQQIMSESLSFTEDLTNYILAYFLLGHGVGIIKEHDFQVLHGSVETLIR